MSQLPLEQLLVQVPELGQVNAQLPLEQSSVHGDVMQVAEQSPLLHEQLPPLHVMGFGVPAMFGMTGPPFGVPVVVELDPHAATTRPSAIAQPLRVVMKPPLFRLSCALRPTASPDAAPAALRASFGGFAMLVPCTFRAAAAANPGRRSPLVP